MKRKVSPQNGFEVKLKAARKYYPDGIIHALKRDSNGVVYADKSLLVHTEEEERDFILTLDFLYRLAYNKDIHEATIFLEVNGNTIRGGAYYPATQEHGKSFVVAYKGGTSYNDYWWCPRLYFENKFDEICKRIKEA